MGRPEQHGVSAVLGSSYSLAVYTAAEIRSGNILIRDWKNTRLPLLGGFSFLFSCLDIDQASMFMEKGTLPGARRFCWGLNAARGGLGREGQEVDTEEFAQALQKQPPRGGGLEHHARDPGLRVRGRGSRGRHPTATGATPSPSWKPTGQKRFKGRAQKRRSGLEKGRQS